MKDQETIREEMDKIYRELPKGEIPWNIESPPEELASLVEMKVIRPCRAVDLGCGAGNYMVWLASLGFEMTGIDISSEAIGLALENARKKKVTCKCIVADLTSPLGNLTLPFEFAYDWEVLHHVFPEKRMGYFENVCRLLVPGGLYLSVCFSEKDEAFGSREKYRTTSIGTVLYFSSEKELRELYHPCFHILELKTIEIKGKLASHKVNYAILKKK